MPSFTTFTVKSVLLITTNFIDLQACLFHLTRSPALKPVRAFYKLIRRRHRQQKVHQILGFSWFIFL
jgi:hypothetical protein